MKRKISWPNITFLVCICTLFLMGVLGNPAYPMHNSGTTGLICGGCHTMHDSEGNLSMGGDPSPNLIRATDINALCLRCHEQGGSLQVAYDGPIIKSAAGNPFTNPMDFNAIAGSGDLFYLDPAIDASGAWATGYGHNLSDLAGMVPPGGTQALTEDFSCMSCHDPHGVVNGSPTTDISDYRNLRCIPKGSGSTSVAISGTETLNYTTLANGEHVFTNADTVYDSGPDSISRWCGTCHDNFHNDIAVGGNTDGTDWLRHPVGVNVMDAGADCSNCHDGGNNIMNLPYEGNGKTSCVSCHFAHAGPYKNALRFDYENMAPGTGCRECHKS